MSDTSKTDPPPLNIDIKMLEALVCPLSKQALHLNKDTNELWSRAARCAFPIENDIPILVPALARPLEHEEWQTLKSQNNSGL